MFLYSFTLYLSIDILYFLSLSYIFYYVTHYFKVELLLTKLIYVYDQYIVQLNLQVNISCEFKLIIYILRKKY